MNIKARKRKKDEYGRENDERGKIEKKVIDTDVSLNDSSKEIEYKKKT